MVGHFLGGLSPLEVATRFTWPELQALFAHWQYEPPVPAILARYFGIEPRPDAVESMSTEAAMALFSGVFAGMSAVGH
jgi:hypothetical protein